jgi:hypothetical protein
MYETCIGTHIAIPWDSCIPSFYGTYNGKLKDGRICTIHVDWKIKAYTPIGEPIGTDQISYWLCDVNHVKSLIDAFENRGQ